MFKILRKLIENTGYFFVNKHDNPGYCLDTDLMRFMNPKLNLTIFDVGANKGDESRRYLKMFPQSKIHAFEPGKACYKDLNRLTLQENRFSFYNIGLGDNDGYCKFNESMYTTISSCLPLEKDNDNVTVTEKITIRSLDSFCSEKQIGHIDLIKIDVQGYDLRVLEGSSKMLNRGQIKCVLVELPLKSYYKEQANFEEIFIFLKKNNYLMYGLYNLWHDDKKIDHCDGLFISNNF